jgi:hypothetical protein
MSSLRPRHPVDLGLCTYAELDGASRKGFKAKGIDPDKIAQEKQKAIEAEQDELIKEQAASKDNGFGGFDFSNFLGKKSETGE